MKFMKIYKYFEEIGLFSWKTQKSRQEKSKTSETCTAKGKETQSNFGRQVMARQKEEAYEIIPVQMVDLLDAYGDHLE